MDPEVKKKLFWWAINVGKDYLAINNSEYKTPYLLKLKHKIGR